MRVGLIKDDDLLDWVIAERKRSGADRYDEVWEGIYVIPATPSISQQRLVSDLNMIFASALDMNARGQVYPGANLSDRRQQWEYNYRIPDVVVVMADGAAMTLTNHVMGAADFLVEIESPGDDTEEKVPFYSRLGVRELLIIHRDRRTLRLLRHDGEELIEVKPTSVEGKAWLVSDVLPLAFRRKTVGGVPRTDVRRTDGEEGRWTV